AEMASDPADLNAQLNLATSRCQLGSTLEDADPTAAAAEYKACIGTIRRVGATAPERKDISRQLTSHLPGYAWTLAILGQPQALEIAAEAVAIAQSFRESDPASLQARRTHLTTSLVLAGVQLKFGRPASVAATLNPVQDVVDAGALSQISQSLLSERVRFYGL